MKIANKLPKKKKNSISPKRKPIFHAKTQTRMRNFLCQKFRKFVCQINQIAERNEALRSGDHFCVEIFHCQDLAGHQRNISATLLHERIHLAAFQLTPWTCDKAL